MTDKFYCANPDHPKDKPRTYEAMPNDGFCPDCGYGQSVLIPVSEAELQQYESDSSLSMHSGEIGLCILICDASISMHNTIFPGNPARKIDLITGAAASGITDLYSITSSTDAFIALIAFGASARFLKDPSGNLFLKSIHDIQEEFPTAEQLGKFLSNALQNQCADISGSTNITEALTLGKEVDSSARIGSLSKYGGPDNFVLKEHDILVKKTNRTESIPNIRTMIYSDGGHNVGHLSNSYAADEYSTLMTMFFGPYSNAGAKQMENMACVCPDHEKKGFFLIDVPTKYTTLRHLFRMASGASGFCESCSKTEQVEFSQSISGS